MKIAFLTNVTTALGLPMLRALARSTEVDLCHVLFYDTVAEAKGAFWSVLREQGLQASVAKGIRWFTRSTQHYFRHLLGSSGGSQFCYEYAVDHDLPYSVFRDMNREAVVTLLKRLEIDILLVCSCRQILKSEILCAPKIASINVHPSLLPKFRGPMPVFWTLYHGEAQAGVTFHLMNERIDDGDVIAQFIVPIDAKMSEQALSNRLFETAAVQVETVLHDFVEGESKPQPQHRNHASYQSYPTSLQRRRLLSRTRIRKQDPGLAYVQQGRR